MACPNCGCMEVYEWDDEDDAASFGTMERCAACGLIFDVEDHTYEDDMDAPTSVEPPCVKEK